MAEKHTQNSKTKNTDSNTLIVLPEESTPFDDVYPESAVLYLRGLDEIPDQLSVKIILPDKSEANYHIPTIKLQNYDKQEILHKNLLFFIPYYVLKFEEKLEIIDSQEDKLEEVIADYQEIYEHLRRLEEQQYIDNDYLHNLLNLIQKLIDVVAHDAQNFRRRVSIMGGKVLELPSEQIRRDGRAEGEVQAKKKMVRNLHKQGDSLKKIADAVEMSMEEVKEILSEPHENQNG